MQWQACRSSFFYAITTPSMLRVSLEKFIPMRMIFWPFISNGSV